MISEGAQDMFIVRVTALAAMFVFLVGAPAPAQTDVQGEWQISFETPIGPAEFTMYVMQTGPRLTGRLTSDRGEFPLRGAVDGDAVKITWQLPDGDKIVDVTFTVTVNGDSMKGTAKLEKIGEGPLSGDRTDHF
jgi:hypothetical protein